MNKATLQTLTTLARRASDRASAYAMAGERAEARQWADVARCAAETASALEKALR